MAAYVPGGGTYDTNTQRYAPIPAQQSDALRAQRAATPPSSNNSPSAAQAYISSLESNAPSDSNSNGGGNNVLGGGNFTNTSNPAAAPAPTGPSQAEIEAQNNARMQEALNRALGYGSQQVTNLGLNAGLIDQYGILDAYNEMVNRRFGEIDPTNADPYAQYSVDSYFNNALDSGLNRYRADLRNSIMDPYGDGFEYNLFGNDIDDPILQSIYDAQRSDAQLVLDRAKARGQLNDVGYNRAVGDLNTQGLGGMATLQDLGGGVLTGYRQQLSDLRDQGLNRAGQASFSQPFNSQSIVDQLNSLSSDLSNRLEGDINKAVGGTTFFTPTVSIGKGGATQGTINPSKINYNDNPLLQAFLTDSGRRTYGNNSGSTASTGAF